MAHGISPTAGQRLNMRVEDIWDYFKLGAKKTWTFQRLEGPSLRDRMKKIAPQARWSMPNK